MFTKLQAVTTVVASLFCLATSQQYVPEETGAVYSVGFDPFSTAVKAVPYEDDGEPLTGYVVYDNTTDAVRPGVLLVPDWDGIGAYELWRAKLLAALGYVAFVADVFGDEVEQGPALPIPQRANLTRSFRGQPLRYRARLQTALAMLRDQEFIDKSNLAAIGYCFGGSGVLELFRSWPQGTEGLQVVVSFHAGGLSTTASTSAPYNPIAVSIQHGEEDASVAPEDIDFIKNELTEANVTSWEFTSYGGAGHAFTEPSLVPGFGNNRYSEWADLRSWAAMRSLFTWAFAKADSSNPYAAVAADAAVLQLG